MINKPTGTKDVLPSEVYKWKFVEDEFDKLASIYGYNQIRTPMFENTSLFKRGVGETTDIVKKEMFSVISDANLKKAIKNEYDINKDGFTLKPEGTAPVVRSFVENKLYTEAQPTKVYYNTPCFRNERPQAGRLREFHQFGIEVFSTESAISDAEVITFANRYFNKLGLKNIELRINSVGCNTCRPIYHQELKEFLKPNLHEYCQTCQERYETNPLRILDCKNDKCQSNLTKAPTILNHLCDSCKVHFDELKVYLDSANVHYTVDPKIVRGLDYYTKSAFEFVSNDLGSQSTVCGGGRYDGLVEDVGGPRSPGVGFGMGIERLLMILEEQNVQIPKPKKLDAFIVHIGDKAKFRSVELLYMLRDKNISVEMDPLSRSVKAQFRYADKKGAKYVITIGDNEIENNRYSVKNLETSTQEMVDHNNILEFIGGNYEKI
jgi:histidyl-tRNA synthetase